MAGEARDKARDRGADGSTDGRRQEAPGKRIFLVAGEHSGDFLGAALIASLSNELECKPEFAGVGGELMEAEGLHSLFPLNEVAVMGLTAVLPRLPTIIKRVYQTVDAACAFSADIVVIIDSPEFTHAIARRIRRKMPQIPIVNYVSPSVWAWRPGRAKKMTAYVDHILALLPFEPEAHKRLGGPACTYVGHPLVEKNAFIQSCSGDELQTRLSISPKAKKLVVLPGSRSNEVKRLMEPFGEAIDLLRKDHEDLHLLVPAMPSVAQLIKDLTKDWSIKPHILHGERDKFAAFNLADAALAASGTVTLELGVAKVPMVVAYKMGKPEYSLRRLVTVHSIVLANLVLAENVFPEFLQENCTPDALADAVSDLLQETPALAAQRTGLDLVVSKIMLKDMTPSQKAAKVVMSYLEG